MKRLRVLVTDAHDRAGLAVVRSLGRAGHAVTAAFPDTEASPASVWSRYCSGSLRHPDPWRCTSAFRDWLHAQANGGRFDAVWPTSEASLTGCRSVRTHFPDGCLPILPSDAALAVTLSKFLSTRMARLLGVTCPATLFVSDGTRNDGGPIDLSPLRFPIVLKTDNYFSADGAYLKGARFFARDADEAVATVRDLMQQRTPIIAQEWIPGGGEGACLLRFGDETHLRFAYRRLHEVPYSGGYSSLRESARDDGLIEIGKTLLDAVGFEGIAMVEFRRRADDARPYFLEINGRAWGSLALALHAGVDFPRALLECYQLGRPTQAQPAYRPGIKCRNVFRGECVYLSSVVRAPASALPARPPSRSYAVAEFLLLCLNPAIRHDHFWWSDPLPAVVQATRTLAWIARMIVKHIPRLRSLPPVTPKGSPPSAQSKALG